MPRPRLPVGTHGDIATKQLPAGSWKAQARYRGYDGRTSQPSATGPSRAKAVAALKTKLLTLSSSASGDTLTPDSTVSVLLDRWMTEVEQRETDGQIVAATVGHYRDAVDKVVRPAIGALTIRECTTQRVDRFLRAIEMPSSARSARTVLSQAFGLAQRFDAVRFSPVAAAYRPPAAKTSRRALTVEDVHELRRRTRAWQDAQRLGPKRGYDLVEIVDTMLGTSARIGEALAIRWTDIEGLDGDGAVVVTICGTVSTAGGVHRQPWTKTSAGYRAVTVPSWTANSLRRQRARGIPSVDGLAFPTRTGGPRWPANVRTQWRQVRGDDYAWVKPHTFRKTVATIVEREIGLDAASKVLGHSGTAVTSKHYIERAALAPDASKVLDRFGDHE